MNTTGTTGSQAGAWERGDEAMRRYEKIVPNKQPAQVRTSVRVMTTEVIVSVPVFERECVQ